MDKIRDLYLEASRLSDSVETENMAKEAVKPYSVYSQAKCRTKTPDPLLQIYLSI